MSEHPDTEPQAPSPAPAQDDIHNLRKKTVKSVLWSFAEMFGRYGATYIVTIYLARLLSPADYGVIGLATAIFLIAGVIIDSGLKRALIRKQNVTNADYNTAFFTNLTLAVVIYAAVYLITPAIARFYGEPQLIYLIRLLGITLIMNAITVVPNADLQRNMRFSRFTLITAPAEVISGATAITLAYNGFGIMSLAAKILLGSFIGMILHLFAVKWRPSFEFNTQSFKELFSVGAKLGVISFMRELGNNMCVMVIGKIYTTYQLGYYSFSTKILNFTANSITFAVSQVTLASFSKIQDDNAKLLSGYKQALRSTTGIVFPLMAVMGVTAEPLIRIFLNENWLPAVPYIQILCAQGALASIYMINSNILMIKNINLHLKIECAAVLTLIGTLFALVPLGINFFLIGLVLRTLILVLILNHCKTRYINCSFWSTAKLLTPITVSAAVTGAAVYTGMRLLAETEHGINILQFTALYLIAAIIYCCGLWIFRVDEFMSIIRKFSKP